LIQSSPNNVNLTLENVTQLLNGLEFFKRYVSDFPGLERSFSSPFREDKNPSCKVFERDGEYIMYDYTSKETYGVVKFTMEYYGCTFGTALAHIDKEFNLGIASGESVSNLSRQTQALSTSNRKYSKRIQIKSMSWGRAHAHYWQQHGYDLGVVKKLGIVPISHYWISQGHRRSMVAVKQIGFAYTEWSPRYKIYLPHEEKGKKFASSTRGQNIQCGKFLPKEGEVLILTSSMKDCVFFWNAGIPAVAPQSESPKLNKHFTEYIKKRFKQILIIYDNDYEGEENWGQINAKKLAEAHPTFKNVVLPPIAKDPSEFALQMGYQNAHQRICESIYNQTGIDICQQETREKGIIMSSTLLNGSMPF